MTSHTEITAAQLMRLVGTPQSPLIVDARTSEDYDVDPWILPGAIRHDWRDAIGLAPQIGGHRVIVYCQKGLKISQGVAAQLRLLGHRAETLEGGQVAWRQAGHPVLRGDAVPPGTIWVTRHRPKIDRVACPWLLRRFVDAGTRILFVAPSQVANVAERFDAVPFDAEGAAIADRDGRCSFDALLDHLGLEHPPLRDMADVIRAADLGHPAASDQAAGLTAILMGLSRMFRDDLQQVEASLPVFDALYRWTRDAADETHEEAAP